MPSPCGRAQHGLLPPSALQERLLGQARGGALTKGRATRYFWGMKKVILLLLAASGCAPHNHKAQDAISAYVRKTAQDPGSYVAISFGEAHATAPKADTVLINHVYQIKNQKGASVIYSIVFKVDSASGFAKPLEAGPKAK